MVQRLFKAGFVVAIVLFAMPQVAHAATPGLNLQISPLPILLNTEPGQPVTTDLRVRNGGTQTEQLKVTIEKFSADSKTGEVSITDPTAADTYIDWATVSQPVFSAPAGTWQTIHLTISPPKDAAFGYYYAVQFSRATEEKPAPGTQHIQGAVAIFVLLNVNSPNAKRELKISQFSVNHHLFEFLPATFDVTIRNSGNVHAVPHGNIFIMRGNKTISTLAVNTTNGSILPNSPRTFVTQWSEGFPVYAPKTLDGQPVLGKNNQPAQTLHWDFSQVTKLRFGHYTAKLLMVYDDGHRDVPITSTVSFWVIPWRIIAIAIAIPLLPAASVFLIMRWRYKRKARRGAHHTGKI